MLWIFDIALDKVIPLGLGGAFWTWRCLLDLAIEHIWAFVCWFLFLMVLFDFIV